MRVQLTGVTVAPRDTGKISLAGLGAEGSYFVYCKVIQVTNQQYDPLTDPVSMVFGTAISVGIGATFSLDGKILRNSQGPLPKETSLTASNVFRGDGSLTFYNMDLNNSVEISGCFATPSSGSPSK